MQQKVHAQRMMKPIKSNSIKITALMLLLRVLQINLLNPPRLGLLTAQDCPTTPSSFTEESALGKHTSYTVLAIMF